MNHPPVSKPIWNSYAIYTEAPLDKTQGWTCESCVDKNFPREDAQAYKSVTKECDYIRSMEKRCGH